MTDTVRFDEFMAITKECLKLPESEFSHYERQLKMSNASGKLMYIPQIESVFVKRTRARNNNIVSYYQSNSRNKAEAAKSVKMLAEQYGLCEGMVRKIIKNG